MDKEIILFKLWEDISVHFNDTTIQCNNLRATFDVKPTNFYSYLRLYTESNFSIYQMEFMEKLNILLVVLYFVNNCYMNKFSELIPTILRKNILFIIE